jgi:shikimate kinase
MKGITLIGMPSSGKSTIGKLLAENLKWKFIDLDELISQEEGIDITELIQKKGEKELSRLETDYTLKQDLSNIVFAPGGSIIYSETAMEKIKKETAVIYLEIPLDEIEKRISKHRRSQIIVGLKEKGLPKLFEERILLYKLNADQTVDCSRFNQCLDYKAVINYIISLLPTAK